MLARLMLLAPLVAVEDGLGHANALLILGGMERVKTGDAVEDGVGEANERTVVVLDFGIGPNTGVEGGEFLLSHVVKIP